MLASERQAIILETVNSRKSVALSELAEILGASESTVRRDLASLDSAGKINKVHGGAVSLVDSFSANEFGIEEKNGLYNEEKNIIAKAAADLITDDDFVYLDAGTTTYKLIEYLSFCNATFVTNGFVHAHALARKGFKVLVPSGEIKIKTEAIVGAECVEAISRFNFTKCFIGTNGISARKGYTTPDMSEAMVKKMAIENSREAYILADSSKFGKITAMTFAQGMKPIVLTDAKPEDKFYDNLRISVVKH